VGYQLVLVITFFNMWKFCFVLFWQYSGPHACQAGLLALKQHCIVLGVFKIASCKLFAWGWFEL
jgi:hypothetical protein